MYSFSGVRRDSSRLRQVLRGTAAIAPAFILCNVALIQTAIAQNTPGSETVVVTGTRITTGDFASPTPVTALSAEQLTADAPSTLADALKSIPALSDLAGPQRNSGTVNGGSAYINLRNLGTDRTLTLLDGQRIVPSATTDATDVNLIPSALLERVDIVTGGASAAYGSDAVAGVVNFILNRQFTGLKANVQYGMTDYGDNQERTASVAYGQGFFDDKIHVVASAEFYDDKGIPGVNQRPWTQQGWMIITNPTGTPTNIAVVNGRNVVTAGGLVVSGSGGTAANNASFSGINFVGSGVPTKYNYGTLSTSGTQEGGDGINSSQIQQLYRPLRRSSLFFHTDYNVNDDTRAYVELAMSGEGITYINGPETHTGTNTISVKSDNAFLPASIASRMAALGVTSLNVARWDDDNMISTHNENATTRFVTGVDTKLFGWNVTGYYEYGVNRDVDFIINDAKPANFALAADAVYVTPTNVGASGLPIGTIVCRSSLTNPTNGCVPTDIFGPNMSAASEAYINGTNQLYQWTTENVLSLSGSGPLFQNWAGTIQGATGFEYRRETAKNTVDPLSLTNSYTYGNPQPWAGEYTVNEGFVEFDVPLLKELPFAQALDVDVADRMIGYSTSGEVNTWKVGGNYNPIDDLRIRGTISRDIRAPSLSELFTAGRQAVTSPNDPFKGNARIANIPVFTTGNPNLKPEVADTLTYGAVYTPSWLPTFNFAVDYYHIDLKEAIASIDQQTVLNECFAGVTSLCALIHRDANGNLTSFSSYPINYSAIVVGGVDFDVSYAPAMADWFSWWKGDLSLRGLANYDARYRSVIPGVSSIDSAGTVGQDSLPRWEGQLQANYALEPINFFLAARYVDGGHYLTSQYTTARYLAFNDVSNRIYFDTKIGYDIPGMGNSLEVYLSVRNLFNLQPPYDPQAGNLIAETNAALYDTIGRMYRVGVNFHM